MVEIRDIPNDELPPEDLDCVLIEKLGCTFRAKGSAGAPNDPTFYNPPAFPTLDAAIEASMAWAAMNDIPLWRDNLSEKSATIWMRCSGHGVGMIVAERQ